MAITSRQWFEIISTETGELLGRYASGSEAEELAAFDAKLMACWLLPNDEVARFQVQRSL